MSIPNGAEELRIPRGQAIDQNRLHRVSQQLRDPAAFSASVLEWRPLRAIQLVTVGYGVVFVPLLSAWAVLKGWDDKDTMTVAVVAAAAVVMLLVLFIYDRATVGSVRRKLHAAYMRGGYAAATRPIGVRLQG